MEQIWQVLFVKYLLESQLLKYCAMQKFFYFLKGQHQGHNVLSNK